MRSFFSKLIASIGIGFFAFALPVAVMAQNIPPSITPSQTVNSGEAQGKIFGITYECDHGKPGECTFADLVAAVQHVINWGTMFALAFSVVVIAWAGWQYMTSGDNAGQRTKANNMLLKVVIGIAWMLGAWLVVKLITTALGVDTGISTLG